MMIVAHIQVLVQFLKYRFGIMLNIKLNRAGANGCCLISFRRIIYDANNLNILVNF
jgi:hypothetical protein